GDNDVFLLHRGTILNQIVAFRYSPLRVGKWLSVPSTTMSISKHMSCDYNTAADKMYCMGGDNSGSYNQTHWILDLDTYLDSASTTDAGIAEAYPQCGTSGLQPKYPDYVNYLWDSTRSKFWMMGGIFVSNLSLVCANADQDETDDPPHWYHGGHIFRFDPASPSTSAWELAGLLPSDFGHNAGEKNWGAVYDPVTDKIFKPWQEDGSTGYLDTFNAATQAWTVRAAGIAGGGCQRSQLAVDRVGRKMYCINTFT